MRSFSLILTAATLFTTFAACGANSGTPQDANTTHSATGGGNDTAPQNGNAAQNGNAPQNGNAVTTSVTGTVQGHGLTAKSAIYAVGVVPGADGNTNVLSLLISDQPDACATVTSNAHTKNSTSLTFVLLKGDANGKTVAPTSGTYSLSSGAATSLQGGQAAMFVYDATCTATLPDDNATVSGGTVHVTSTLLDNTTPLVGTFSLTVGTQGDQLTGSFQATGCPGLITVAAQSGAAKTCK